jgi:hypothetical protein
MAPRHQTNDVLHPGESFIAPGDLSIHDDFRRAQGVKTNKEDAE